MSCLEPPTTSPLTLQKKSSTWHHCSNVIPLAISRPAKLARPLLHESITVHPILSIPTKTPGTTSPTQHPTLHPRPGGLKRFSQPPFIHPSFQLTFLPAPRTIFQSRTFPPMETRHPSSSKLLLRGPTGDASPTPANGPSPQPLPPVFHHHHHTTTPSPPLHHHHHHHHHHTITTTITTTTPSPPPHHHTITTTTTTSLQKTALRKGGKSKYAPPSPPPPSPSPPHPPKTNLTTFTASFPSYTTKLVKIE